jgi:hypothetical protein
MRHVEAICLPVLLLALSSVSTTAHSQGRAEDLTPCGAPHPEPAQAGAWAVAFCNRTGHDLIVQFHDNDCPADNWSRRGSVYEKQLARGESVTVALCYARESPQSAGLAPGVPMLRLPGGKGVVTTWNIIGDCGDRSDRQHVDGRSFYDRGSYETGIILLQYPSGASHCLGAPDAPPEVGPAAGVPSSGTTAPALTGGPPALSAMIDTKDRIPRVVHVLATSAADSPAYRCKFRLTLDFSDGLSWVDQPQADVPMGAQSASIYTRKYTKTITKVALSAQKCTPL